MKKDMKTRVESFMPNLSHISLSDVRIKSVHRDSFDPTFILQFKNENDPKKFGGTIWKDDHGQTRMSFGSWKGEKLIWINEQSEFSYSWTLIGHSSQKLLNSERHGLTDEIINFVFGADMWKEFYKNHKQECDQKRSEFEKTNHTWQQLQELNSDQIKEIMSEDQRKALGALYQARLEKDPDYIAIQEDKQDLLAIDTYIKYREKLDQKDKREGFKMRLDELKEEYDSEEIKALLPDEKLRLAVRGAIHKIKKRSI